MTKVQQGLQGAESDATGFNGLVRAVLTYLAERFPVSQAGAVLFSYACCYLLYGQADGHQVFQWETVVGGITVVLMALFLRIVDDIEDLREDLRTGRFSFADGGRSHLRGLILGGGATMAFMGVLNATCSIGMLAATVGVAVWCPAVLVIKKTAVAKPLQYFVVETGPAAFLLYSYVVWTEASGGSIPLIGVGATVGLFWTTFQFWSFTRKIGTENWSPWGLTVNQTRSVLIGLLVFAALCSLLIAHYAHLTLGYSFYGLALSGVFISLVLRWWSSQLPTPEPDRVGAAWAGLPFALAVAGGVLIGVLVSAL
ncbi:MAG: hypothetical protein ACTHNP_02150 [Solirubrobacterales bacterium]